MTEEKVLFEGEFHEYVVHFKIRSDNRIEFHVYPILQWTRVQTGESGFCYIDKENEPDSRDDFEEGKCLKKFKGSYVWRGVWEGRIYFTDEEYWGEEMMCLAKLYEGGIIPWCEKEIKKRTPHAGQ